MIYRTRRALAYVPLAMAMVLTALTLALVGLTRMIAPGSR